MSIFYETILDLLNSLLPAGDLATDLASLNEVLSYFIVVGVIYTFLVRPILKLLRLSK